MTAPAPEPSPRRAVVVQGFLYLVGLFIVAIVTARAASYDTQINNLRQQVADLNVQLSQESEEAVITHRRLETSIAELSARVAALERIHSVECTHGGAEECP